jgi:hypothetical protein
VTFHNFKTTVYMFHLFHIATRRWSKEPGRLAAAKKVALTAPHGSKRIQVDIGDVPCSKRYVVSSQKVNRKLM